MAKKATINPLLKKLAAAKRKRQDLGRQHEQAKRDENELIEQVMEELNEMELTRAAIEGVVNVSLGTNTVYKIEDDTKFYAFVKRHGAFELLERRVAQRAAAERFSRSKRGVPGLEEIDLPKLNVTLS